MNTRRSRWVTAFLAGILVLTGLSGANAETLRVAVNAEARPFVYIGDDGSLQGFNVDIAKAVCEAMSVTCELVPIPFRDIIGAIQDDKVDFAVASMLHTADRDLLVDFTERYWRSTSTFIGHSGVGLSITETGLTGKRIAVQAGSTQERWLVAKWGTVVSVQSYPKAEDRWQALVEQRADMVLAPTLTAFNFLTSEYGQDFDFIGPAMMEDNLGGEACLTVHEGDDDLRTRLNGALYDIRQSGLYDQISRRYFPISIY